MNAAQGVILVMMGALILYLTWHPQLRLFAPAPLFGRGTPSLRPDDGPVDPTGGLLHTQPGDPNPRSVPDQCIGTVGDYWCGSDHYVNGALFSSGSGGFVPPQLVAGRPS